MYLSATVWYYCRIRLRMFAHNVFRIEYVFGVFGLLLSLGQRLSISIVQGSQSIERVGMHYVLRQLCPCLFLADPNLRNRLGK